MVRSKLSKILLTSLASVLLLVGGLEAYGVSILPDIVTTNLKVDNIEIDTNTISSTNTDGDIILNPNGAGNVKFPDLTVSIVPYIDASGNFASSAVTPTELGYLSGVGGSLATDAELTAHAADTTSVHGITDTSALVTLTGVQVLNDKFLQGDSNVNGDLKFLDEGEARFYEASGGANYVALKAPASVSADVTLTLPADDGDSNEVLKTDGSGGLEWVSVAGLNNLAVSTKTAAYTATTGDDVILADASGGAFTITLYTASGNSGKVLRIKKISTGSNEVTVDGDGSETIGGYANVKLSGRNDAVTLASDGTNWQLLSDEITVAAAADAGTPTGTLNSSQNNVVFGTLTQNTQAAYNTTTGEFTAPYSGVYVVTATLGFAAASASVGNYYSAGIRLNGTTMVAENFHVIDVINRTTKMVAVSASRYLAAGDTVAITTRTTVTTPTYSTSLGGSNFSITRIR